MTHSIDETDLIAKAGAAAALAIENDEQAFVAFFEPLPLPIRTTILHVALWGLAETIRESTPPDELQAALQQARQEIARLSTH